jgi:hypothetical protein
MPAQVTSKQIARKFPSANLSALPTSNPGGGKPWLHGSGSVVVGAFAGVGVTDHGALSGLGDDDHTQYYNAVRLAIVLADYLPLAGGVVTGELFIASGGGLYLYDPTVDTDLELTVVDGDLFVGGVALARQSDTTNASNLTSGTVADARLSANVARTTNPLSQFAATTSAQIRGVISDETGTGALVFAGGDIGAATGTSLTCSATVTAGGSSLTAPNIAVASGFGVGFVTGNLLLFSGSTIAAAITNDGFIKNYRIPSDWVFGWASSTNNQTAADTGYARVSAGVVEINNGTAGSLRDLSLRNLTASGNITLATTAGGGGTAITTGTWGPTPSIQTTVVHRGTGICYVTSGWGMTFINHQSFASSVNVAPDVFVNRSAAGVLQVGTSTVNALGSLNLANLTTSAGLIFTNQPNGGVSTQIVADSPIPSYSSLKFAPVAGTNAAASLNLIGRGTFGSNGVRSQITVYGTDANADPTNYEFAAFRAVPNLFTLTSGKSGTGSNRPFMLASGFASDGATNNNQLVLETDGRVSTSGGFLFAPRTKSALLATSATATAGVWRVTDSTPAQRLAYPDGTNWRYLSDDTVVT